MARNMWILILTVFCTMAQQIHAACICNEKGKDVCSTCPETIRPKPKHINKPKIELLPIGDSCDCSKTIIKPASLRKPSSKLKQRPASCSRSDISQLNSYVVPQVNYMQANLKAYSRPADPISVSLATQASKSIEVPEAKLAYGFLRKPINRMPKVYISSIKEENLHALANDVLTLKKPLAINMKKLEEDCPESEEEESIQEDYEPPILTYKQLGYEAEQFKNPEFIPMPAITKATGTLYEDNFQFNYGIQPRCITQFEDYKKYSPINCILKY